MEGFLLKWAGVISLVFFAFWVSYNVYQNWRDRKEKKDKDSASVQAEELEFVKEEIEKLKDRLVIAEMLITFPGKLETEYSPSKGITIINKPEKDL